MLKIIGGTKKRTKLEVAEKNLRPTTSKKRESIFSIIESFAKKKEINLYLKTCVLDLFAGTGSLGLESLSRGAKFCYFYENNLKNAEILKNNCLKISNPNNFKIIKENVNITGFKEIKKKISLLFIDPPYIFNNFNKLLTTIINADILLDNSIIIIETHKSTKVELLGSMHKIDERIYGITKITFILFKY